GELRVAAPRRARQREGPAEARVDVRDGEASVRLPEALDVRRPDDPDRLGHAAAVLDQLRVLDGHALDRLAALGLDHRARDRVQAAALRVAEDVDGELLAEADLLDERLDRRVTEEELELRRILGAIDVARAEALAHLDQQRVARVCRSEERRVGKESRS